MKREDSSPSPASGEGQQQQQQQQVSPEDQELKAQREARKKAKEAEKAAKEAAKLNRKKAMEEARAAQNVVAEDWESSSFGYFPLMNSSSSKRRQFVAVGQLKEKEGSLAFAVLREGLETAQIVFSSSLPRPLLKWLEGVPVESLIDVFGVVAAAAAPLVGVSQQHELHAEKVFCVVRAPPELPFRIRDAMQPDNDNEAQGQIRVHLDTRLEHRWLDLRVAGTFAVACAVSEVSRHLRDYLLHEKCIEIHTPKILGGASEGGAFCFELNYFNQPACLAQSPQLYKQMCIAGDMKRVFEIGPVFRAENSNTHRHLCEFVGVDLEMEIKETYIEAVDLIDNMFKYLFKKLETDFTKESAIIRAQHDVPPFEFLEETPRLTFAEGVAMLREAGIGLETIPEDISNFDLSTELEKALGALVKKKYNTDFYILLRYPTAVRPFYSMPCPDDPRFSNTFDVFMRGEEIASGAQRLHDAELLKQCCSKRGIDVQQLRSYIKALELGAPPHAGMGAGLERIVMLYFGLGNIRRVSLFPRDPKRLFP
ncbi:aspartyl-tRNA synthetase, putative [Eimeria acervulina]|uniref:aspartate--tRNA ligase n=1 Tax=Eimeria acervulina TaxID=5801 RepID=U6GG71_EIMAC|nr:aspartyl-tRNA synthetase, putative [Eimeria acervulina]CDI77579.1 aspartyl-tRNA synthetase, putative [Eimeria acervulina]